MGMAASQARLLSLTSRLHDVEYKAQSIEAQKIALATQKDEVYQEYCDALDATRFQVAFRGADATTDWVTADFNNLCTFQGGARVRDYALRDNRTNKLIVSEETKKNYDNFKNDKYAFAWAMLGYMEGLTPGEQANFRELGANSNTWSTTKPFQVERVGTDGGSSVMTPAEWDAYEKLEEGDTKTKLGNLFQNIVDADQENNVEERDKAFEAFREALYSTPEFVENLYGDKMNQSQGSQKTWGDIQEEFNYYCRQWEAINSSGGCQAIEPQFESGDSGEAWLKNMVEAGLITIIENTEPKGATGKWSDTSVATSTNGNYLKEENDTRNQKKAEAEYEHELSIINRKDTKFDTELSKLETERTSITTEMDAIKSVRDDNIDRTFGIFS